MRFKHICPVCGANLNMTATFFATYDLPLSDVIIEEGTSNEDAERNTMIKGENSFRKDAIGHVVERCIGEIRCSKCRGSYDDFSELAKENQTDKQEI